MELKIKKLRPDAKIPFRATAGSAGIDLSACIDEAKTIAPGELLLIPTGIAIEIPSPEYVAYIFARSGLGIKHGICLANGVGVVDSDYRGEVCVGLCNVSNKEYTITPGDEEQVLITKNLRMTDNITVKAVPSNYGKIDWNGQYLVVS